MPYMIDVDRTGRFHLPDSFIDTYKQRPAPWGFGALSWFTYRRTYSRDGERWYQTCRRVIEGMFTALRWRAKSLHVPFDEAHAQGLARDAYARMFEFKWLPPGRGLWMMGTDFVWEDGAAALNNCAFVSTQDMGEDAARPFEWTFHMLMLGVGVGFDTRGRHLSIPLPPRSPAMGPIHVVDDTRQGWAGVVRLVIEAELTGAPEPRFDVSLVRPAGAPIKRFGGTASGPGPLLQLVRHFKVVFDRARQRCGRVDSTLITDLMNIIGRCVVAGNVRRSAQIALGDLNDSTFAGLKGAEFMPQMDQDADEAALEGKRPWMWSSNNSVTIRCTDDVDYGPLAERIVFNGEPGFFWLDNARNYGRMLDGFNEGADPRVLGCNPCVEQSLEPNELCCLVETFPAHHDNAADYRRTLKVAYLYAKAVTALPTHDLQTNAVMRANSRIGCSMSGITQAMAKFGTGRFFDMCDRAYEYITRLDVEYSRWLAMPTSIKRTSVKPSGTVSLLAGAAPGCHDDHAPYTIRRIRVGVDNPIHEHAARCGYTVEHDVVDSSMMVIEFPVATRRATRSKADVSMWEQFSRAAKLQRYWADNQVSATVTFQEHEAPQIASALEHYADQLKGVSLLALDVSAYAQTPYEAISAERYASMRAKVDPAALMRFDDVQHDRTERFCDGDACEVK